MGPRGPGGGSQKCCSLIGILLFLLAYSACKILELYAWILWGFSNGGKKKQKREKEKNTKNSGSFVWASYQNSKNIGLPELLRWHKHLSCSAGRTHFARTKIVANLVLWQCTQAAWTNVAVFPCTWQHKDSALTLLRPSLNLIVFYRYMCYLRYWPCIVQDLIMPTQYKYIQYSQQHTT